MQSALQFLAFITLLICLPFGKTALSYWDDSPTNLFAVSCRGRVRLKYRNPRNPLYIHKLYGLKYWNSRWNWSRNLMTIRNTYLLSKSFTGHAIRRPSKSRECYHPSVRTENRGLLALLCCDFDILKVCMHSFISLHSCSVCCFLLC